MFYHNNLDQPYKRLKSDFLLNAMKYKIRQTKAKLPADISKAHNAPTQRVMLISLNRGHGVNYYHQ